MLALSQSVVTELSMHRLASFSVLLVNVVLNAEVLFGQLIYY